MVAKVRWNSNEHYGNWCLWKSWATNRFRGTQKGHFVIGIAHRRHRGFNFDNIRIKDMMELTK